MFIVNSARFGFVGDPYKRRSEIRWGVQKNAAAFECLGGVLITCIDSTRFTDGKEVKDLFAKWTDLGSCWPCGLLVDGKGLLELVQPKYNLFNGFDEIWCWPASEHVR